MSFLGCWVKSWESNRVSDFKVQGFRAKMQCTYSPKASWNGSRFGFWRLRRGGLKSPEIHLGAVFKKPGWRPACR